MVRKCLKTGRLSAFCAHVRADQYRCEISRNQLRIDEHRMFGVDLLHVSDPFFRG